MRRAFFIIACLAVLLSCSKGKRTVQTQKNLPGRNSTSAVQPKTNKTNPNKVVLKRTTGSKPGAKEAKGNITDILLPLNNGPSVFPKDFKIGGLQPEIDISKEDRDILTPVKEFLDDFRDRTINKEAVNPDDYQSIKKLYSYYLKESGQVKSYRIGSINRPDKQTATVNSRLFGLKGSTEGQLYLKRKDGKWLITDVQLNLNQLSVKQKKEKFVPNSYSWIMEE